MRFSRAERDPRRADAALQHLSRSLAICADSRSSPVELIRFFRPDQIFGSDDLPAAVAPQRGVGPDDAPTLARTSLPSFASLRNRSITVEPHFHIVKPIRNEILRRVPCIGDHLLLILESTFWIDSDKIVSEDAFNCRHVAGRDRFRPLPFAVEDVALRFFLTFLLAAIAETEHTENRQGAF